VLRARAVREMIAELERCERLGIPYLVSHPGAHGGAGEEAGLAHAARSLGEVLGAGRGFAATVALENTAGQGTQIGYRFEHLGRLMSDARDGDRLRVCVDTQHAFAAGYDLRSAAGYGAAVEALARAAGLERGVAFHLNDAKRGLGARVDRHEHIGAGALGGGAFPRVPRGGGFPGLAVGPRAPKG